jgi:hypothetical protein
MNDGSKVRIIELRLMVYFNEFTTFSYRKWEKSNLEYRIKMQSVK